MNFNRAYKKLIANGLDPETARQRLASAISGGYDFSDTMHNVYMDYGYPQTVSFYQNWNMYRRLGIAQSVVDKPVNFSWMTAPEIESSDQFLSELEQLKNLWVRLRGLDQRQRVGRYAGLFMRVRDGLSPDQPLEPGSLNGPGSLVNMVPLYESQLQVLEVNNDVMSDNYGLPAMYQYSSSVAGNRNEKAKSAFSIHPSRVIIAAEGADDGGIYGIPSLEGSFNSLMDIRKIIGAGGEGFYRNAAQSIVYELTDAGSALQNASLLEKFNENADDFTQNRMRRSLWTPGLKPNTLQSDLMSPKEFFNNALNDVAASSGIPATILIGQQTGRLASDEDTTHMLAMGNSRRANFLTDVVNQVLQWMIDNNVLPAAEFEVVWDDLLELSDEQRLDNADKMATVNEKSFRSGEGTVFTAEEIREQAGYEVEPDFIDDEDTEELPDDGITE